MTNGEGSAFTLFIKRGPRPIEFLARTTHTAHLTRLAALTALYSSVADELSAVSKVLAWYAIWNCQREAS